LDLQALQQAHRHARRRSLAAAAMTQTAFGFDVEQWRRVRRTNVTARALADRHYSPLAARHYSRQTVGAPEFMPPGRTFVLLTSCSRAVWGVVENLDPTGALRWRCSIFRNEGAGLSSDLVRSATARTFLYWRTHYGAIPAVPLRTEIDADAVRQKRNPGYCFLCAGWRVVGYTDGASKGRASLLVLEAPPEESAST
jgi:hypothetical protein